MAEKASRKLNSKKDKNLIGEKNHQTQLTSFTEESLQEYKNKVSELTYKETLEEIDVLIAKLQNDEIPVEELHQKYLNGLTCIERCEELLNRIEQEIIYLEPKKMQISKKLEEN